MCVFCIVAVQGAFQVWSLAMMGVLAGVGLLFSLLIWRQPESKTKLSFKVSHDEMQGIKKCRNKRTCVEVNSSLISKQDHNNGN